MLSLARDGYTSAQVDATLHAETRKMYFRYDLLDLNNNYIKPLTNVLSGSIAVDTTQPIPRTAKFSVLDDGTINFLSNRIKPWARVMMPDGGFAEFPLGVFLLSTPPRVADSAEVITRQIDAYDQCQVLNDNLVTDRYSVPAGTNYITAVQMALENCGFSASQMNLTATSYTLPTAMDFDAGTSYLEIINKLLLHVNYRDIWFDENGIATAIPYVSPSVMAPTYTYQNDSQSVMLPTVTQSLDLFSVPNKWVVTVADVDHIVMQSTYTNVNPNSPTSTVNRGRTIVKYVENLNAALSTPLADFAQRLAYQDSQIYETVTFETAIMPFHSLYDCIQMNYTVMGISNKFLETGWSMDLVAGATMSHTIQSVVNV